MTQETLAELAGLSYKYVGRVELAKADPGADTLVRLARALRVPVGELFQTITPADVVPLRLLPGDVETITSAIAALTATVDQILARQPRAVPPRAPRRRRSTSR
jgi:transcriptional regulator with XRE-family HTH domain